MTAEKEREKLYNLSIPKLEKLANEKVAAAMLLTKNKKIKEYFDKISKEKGIRLKDLRKKILANNLKIDFKGHNAQSITKLHEHFLEEFERAYRDSIISVIQLPDNFFPLHKYYAPIEFGKYIDISDSYCWDCDARCKPVLIDEKTLTFIDINSFFNQGDKAVKNKKIANKFDYRLESLKECPSCELQKIKDKKFVTEINVPSGELAIVNFFKKKELYEDKTSDRRFNSLLGRIKLAQSLEKLDVGFGQMGNMSIEVFVKKDGKEIIFASSYYYDKEKDEEIAQNFRGYICLGSICLDVWRWQCADLETLKKHEEELPQKSEINFNEKSSDYHKMIVAKVKPGKWVIEHFYDIDPSNKIYSRLRLKK